MTTLSQINRGEKILPSPTTIWRDIFQVFGASILMALCSQIKIVLPFTIVPLTCQTFAALLIGATLGSRKGVWALLLYFAEILIGLPVLAGGSINPVVFF
jgi:biotin transport system substrate-specific component